MFNNIKLTSLMFLVLFAALALMYFAATSINSPYAPEAGVVSFPVSQATVGSETVSSGENFIPTIEVLVGQENAGGVTTFPAVIQSEFYTEGIDTVSQEIIDTVMALDTYQFTGQSASHTSVTAYVDQHDHVVITTLFVYMDRMDGQMKVQPFSVYIHSAHSTANIDAALDCTREDIREFWKANIPDSEWLQNALADLDEYHLTFEHKLSQ